MLSPVVKLRAPSIHNNDGTQNYLWVDPREIVAVTDDNDGRFGVLILRNGERVTCYNNAKALADELDEALRGEE